MNHDLTTPPPRLGRLILMPNTLDLGCLKEGDAPPDLQEVLPLGVIRLAASLSHWVAENAKTTRAFLKRVAVVQALAVPLQQQHVAVLPRPAKGAASSGTMTEREWDALLAPALAGHDVGLISEAGLPAVADPGSAVVQAAHRLGIAVLPLAGPSSLMMALSSSGLNGQSFSFVGYLPTDANDRSKRLKELESTSRRLVQTQLAIETPYRNQALLQAMVQTLQPDTWLSVSCGLTLADGWSRTWRVATWSQRARSGSAWPADLPDQWPAVFSWLAAAG